MKNAVLAVLLVCLPAAAQITEVQSKANWGCTPSSCTSPQFNVGLSHLLVVWTFWEFPTGTPQTPTAATVTDSFGNIFYSAVGPTIRSNGTTQTAGQIYYVRTTIAGTNDVVTVAFTNSANISHAGVVIVEYMGADTNNPLDNASASYSSTQSAVLDSGNLILDSSNLLIFAAGIADQPVAMIAGSNYTSLQASTGGFGTGIVESTPAVGTNNTLQRATACIGATLPCPQAGATPANWLMQVAVFRASPSSTVAGGWNPVRPYQVADATQFPGGDPCAQTKTAIETPINSNQAPVVDSRGFISRSIPPCTSAPFLPTDQFQWFAPSGTLPMGSPLVLGGREDIYGTTIAYSTSGGTDFEAQNIAWCPLGICTGGLGGVPQGVWSSATTYYRGSTVTCGSPDCSGGTNTYYALQTSNNQTPSSSPQYWSLASGFPSPVAEENMTTQNADVEANSLHNLSLDCQYANGPPQTWTDGCVGYLSSWGQENTILDRVKIRNATVAGIYLDNTGVADSGPFGPGVIGYDDPGTNSNHAACKTAGSDESTQRASIQSISVSTVGSYSFAQVNLSSTTPLWVGEVVDIVGGAAPFNNIPAGATDETSSTHSFWSIMSVISNSQFLMLVPNSTYFCTSGNCGNGSNPAYANFYPIGLEVNVLTPYSRTRGFKGWTINGSNCTTAPNGGYSYFPPVGAEFSTGNSPMRDFHVEGFRVGVCVGCFGVSTDEEIENAWLEVNMSTGVLIDNKFGNGTTAGVDPAVDIRSLQCKIGSGGMVGPVQYCIVDLGNGNFITPTKNPYIEHYWVDGNGTAYFDGGDCSEMTKGWCRGKVSVSGGTDTVWNYYSGSTVMSSIDNVIVQRASGADAASIFSLMGGLGGSCNGAACSTGGAGQGSIMSMGKGGDATGSATKGGKGGSLTFTAGEGGGGSGTVTTAGAGGDLTLTTGTGGTGTGGTTNGGNGGALVLNTGAGGGGSTGGNPGTINIRQSGTDVFAVTAAGAVTISTPAINQSLTLAPTGAVVVSGTGGITTSNASLDLGTTLTPWRNLYLYGSGTFGTDSFKVTGTPTGNDVLNLPDTAGGTDTLVAAAATQTLTNKSIAASEINSGQLATANGGTNSINGAVTTITGGSSTTGVSLTASSILYQGMGTGAWTNAGCGSSTEALCEIPVPASGNFCGLDVVADSNPPYTVQVTLRTGTNGLMGNTSLTCTLPLTGNTYCEDVGHTATATEGGGNVMDVRVSTGTGSASTRRYYASVKICSSN